jgi:hypothetical protein
MSYEKTPLRTPIFQTFLSPFATVEPAFKKKKAVQALRLHGFFEFFPQRRI